MSRTVYQILSDAQDIIRDESRWTRGAFARDERGRSVSALDPTACCWCASGAIIKAGCGTPFSIGLVIELQSLFLAEPDRIIHTNDDKGHGAVMELFDRLREKTREREEAAS